MSENNDIILHENVLTMLSEMEEVFKRFDIDYYLAGAFARDIYYQQKQSNKDYRKTDDIDLAVFINKEEVYNEVIDALVATGSFIRDEDEIIKLHYKQSLEVDLIPFGDIENLDREVKLTKPKAFTLQMPGFLEVFPFIEIVEAGNLTLKTCPIEGLIMLKLISWDDRNYRTKDLIDIDNIVDAYFDWNADEIYIDYAEVMEIYDVNDLDYYLKNISAHVIGKKIHLLLENSPDLLERVIGILDKKNNPRWRAIKNGLTETE